MMTKDGKNLMTMNQRFKITSTQRRGSLHPLEQFIMDVKLFFGTP